MNAVEKEMAGFWKDLLHLNKEITETDNFFHLGGHSLHTIHLKHFVSQKYNVDISFRNIFENQTLQAMSRLIVSQIQPEAVLSDGQGELRVASNGHGNGNGNGSDLKTFETQTLTSTHPSEEETWTDVENFDDSNFVPLSFGEERLWLVYQFQENKSVYNEVKPFRITGNLDISALEKSLAQLVMRHENLRKKFIEEGDSVRGYVTPDTNFNLRRIHCKDHPGNSFEELSSKVLLEETNKPFDLATDLLLRATLVEFEYEFLLVLTTHHIVTDEWSFANLKKDLGAFYRAFAFGESIEMPSLSKHYQNYAIAERQNLGGENLQQSLNFWLNHLKGTLEKLKLPYDRKLTKSDPYEGAIEEMKIPPSLISSLTKLSQEKNVTLFMTFLAAFHTLLFRYTKNENIRTLTPFAGRQKEETQLLLGFFVNTLLLSTNFSDDPDFTTLLNKVGNHVLDAYEHQDMPFELLADALQKENHINVNDITQVLFVFQNVPNEDLKLDGVLCKFVDPLTTTAKFDLLVSVMESENGQHKIEIEYRKSLFNRSTIQRMAHHFVTLLESIVENPNQKISRLNFVTQGEKELIIKKWNNTTRDIPSLSIHEIFEQQAAWYPKREAISYNDTVLTYEALNNKANQLAHHLIKLGVSSEELVAVFMDETEEAILSLLAVLKAGGAYLPLDPAYPKDRLAYMLENSNTKIVITNSHSQSTLPDEGITKVLLDKQKGEIFNGDTHNPGKPVRPDQLAYVIYTSGSTGKPKGAAIEHCGIVRLLINTDWVNFTSETRHLKTAAFSFDVSGMEVWGTLFNGGRLFLYSREDLLDHTFIKKKIIQEKINSLWLTSAWLSMLVELDPTIFRPLKTVISGGDKLSAKHLNKLMAANPKLEIINAYGPTENSVWSTSYRVEGEQIEPVLIGKPIPNSTAYILDEHLQILPIGIEGEVCLGGVGVARGYINNEEKTKEKFLDDPFYPGGRLYRTGDMGRWLEDGNIEFFGRRDNQIKLRGFRVELGEIEHAIAAHAKVDESVVLAVGDDERARQLICYYTGSEEISDSDFKTFLQKFLPDYMIPFRFVKLSTFPLTPNGKVNRIALQARGFA